MEERPDETNRQDCKMADTNPTIWILNINGLNSNHI